jgi:hypothetical protein
MSSSTRASESRISVFKQRIGYFPRSLLQQSLQVPHLILVGHNHRLPQVHSTHKFLLVFTIKEKGPKIDTVY